MISLHLHLTKYFKKVLFIHLRKKYKKKSAKFRDLRQPLSFKTCGCLYLILPLKVNELNTSLYWVDTLSSLLEVEFTATNYHQFRPWKTFSFVAAFPCCTNEQFVICEPHSVNLTDLIFTFLARLVSSLVKNSLKALNPWFSSVAQSNSLHNWRKIVKRFIKWSGIFNTLSIHDKSFIIRSRLSTTIHLQFGGQLLNIQF